MLYCIQNNIFFKFEKKCIINCQLNYDLINNLNYNRNNLYGCPIKCIQTLNIEILNIEY